MTRSETLDCAVVPDTGRAAGTAREPAAVPAPDEVFRRAQHRVRDVAVSPGDGGAGHISAVATVEYPLAEHGLEQSRPHVSTSDALVIGLQLAEAYLTHTLSLTGAHRRAMWVRRIVMRAGAAPLEDLRGIAVHATHLDTAELPAGGCASNFDCRVGNIKVQVGIGHPAGLARAAGGSYADLEDILGPAETRYYGAGYRLRTLSAQDVQVNLPGRRVDALFTIDPVPGGALRDGLGADYQPSESAVDGVVGLLQLVQLLLCRLDGVDRDQGVTVWMRRIEINCGRPAAPGIRAVTGATATTRSRLLSLGGQTWRNTEIVGQFGGMTGRCVVAHQLPDAA
jgi:hypothetical protein